MPAKQIAQRFQLERDKISNAARTARSDYLTSLSLALNDKAVFDAVVQRLVKYRLDGVHAVQTQPLMVLDFVFRSIGKGEGAEEHLLVGVIIQGQKVSMDIPGLVKSKAGEALVVPFVESVSRRTDIDTQLKRPPSAKMQGQDREFERRIKYQFGDRVSPVPPDTRLPTPAIPADLIDRIPGFDPRRPVWGPISSGVSPSVKKLTRCVVERKTGQYTDAPIVVDDCG